MPVLLNDAHANLNETEIDRVFAPASTSELAQFIREHPHEKISIGGARHALGGQQFGTSTVHLDMRCMNRVCELDAERGLVHTQAGVQWPTLISQIRERNTLDQHQWGIRQKQTGASDLTLGGALAANAHGRGLTMRPMIEDVESFVLVRPDGQSCTCSRTENSDLFSLAIGGYGLFGIITEVVLRLSTRQKVRRVVDVVRRTELLDLMNDEIRRGALYGDFQFDVDHTAKDFLSRGIFSRYRPVADETSIPGGQLRFTPERWLHLLKLARTDKARAFDEYSSFYQQTSGQVYHSDTHQLSTYVPGYHAMLDDLPASAQGTEMITELYVPPGEFHSFMDAAAEALCRAGVSVTYGTVRLIKRETESFLPWARADSVCVIFNLLTPRDRASVDRTIQAFRDLIDLARERGGSYYLTYHRYATRSQLENCYPEIRQFVDEKRARDPDGRIVTTWFNSVSELLND